MYTFGYRSDILRTMRFVEADGYTDELVDSILPILEEPESNRDINFVQEPATVVPSSREFVSTPLHSRRRTPNSERIEHGIYVSVTGIEGLRSGLVEAAKSLGLKIYCPQSAVKEFPEAEVKSPDIVTNHNIEAVFSRFGWGAVALALMAEKPLITTPTDVKDDPEIILNQNLLVNERELASLLDGRDIKEVLEEAKDRTRNTKRMVANMERDYRTVEGPVYVAKIIANSL